MPYCPSEAEFPFEELEAVLNHRFEHRRLLFMAMTHVSCEVTFSNERLEWLGDAALDWMVTRYLYHTFTDAKWMTPGRITEARRAAVCNEAFGRLCVRWQFHKWLRISNAYLQQEISLYAMAVEREENAVVDNEHTDSGQTPDLHTLPPAPKALGDLFEAVAGALLIDVGFDLEAFSSCMMPLLRYHLDEHANPYNLPDNPISEFWHDFRLAGIPSTSLQFIFTDLPACDDTLLARYDSRCECKIIVGGRGEVAHGVGPTHPLARRQAMRNAVLYLRSEGWRDFMN